MDLEKKQKIIIEKLMKIGNVLNEISKQPRDFNTGELLYPSEIHCIDVIYKNQGINLTQLSVKLGVSKSAALKFVKKSLSGGYILKNKLVNNQKNVVFDVTNKGRSVALKHALFSQDKLSKMYSFLKDESENNIDIIIRFLDHFREGLDRM